MHLEADNRSPSGAPPPGAPSPEPLWYTLSAREVAARLGTDPAKGLDDAEAERRSTVHGRNEIREQGRRGPWLILLGQFTDFMILVLIAAAIVSGLIADLQDAIAILAIVVLNGVIGFVQEYRAERAVAALRALAAATATVRRGGGTRTLPAAQLVPGDIVLLEAGNLVPADLRLLESARLELEEAALTGESVPVEKQTEPLEQQDLPLGDRLNMAYKGTVVTRGRCAGIVVATGMGTEFGKIATLLGAEEEPKTPLQRRLAQFGRQLALGAIAICAVVFAVGLLRGEPPALMFLTAVSLAVAAIPEALPAVLTVSLALGAHRMVRRNALIRRLPAVEALGSVTLLCSDKTGTLTQNKMTVERIDADGSTRTQAEARKNATGAVEVLFRALALNNDATLNEGGASGDPTEVALLIAAREAGFDKGVLVTSSPRLAEIPFDSTRKCMTTFHRDGEGIIAFTKGAPERVVADCASVLGNGGVASLDPGPVLERAAQIAASGMRVLAVGCRQWDRLPDLSAAGAVERDLTLIGLVGLIDPPREEAGAAVALCRSAGITPVMITGDHPATAHAIAARVGILDGGGEMMTGHELAHIPPEELEGLVGRIRVYARVAPEQKMKIIRAAQARGEIVAMTGDGVNDAPALKRADIGVAMGRAGTDVAREAASMILLDDNFATIVAAVREGRRIFDNARKFIRYAVTCNSGEIWTIFLAPFLGLPIPLLPIQILWINLVTDGLPGVALAAEPAETDVMARPPRPAGESILARGLWQHAIWVGLLMGGVSLLTQAWSYWRGWPHWQTMVFTVLALSQMGQVMAIRSERESLFRQGVWSNRPLLGAVVLTIGLQLGVIYLPFANAVFKTEPLGLGELVACLLLSSVVFVAVEIEKWVKRSRSEGRKR